MINKLMLILLIASSFFLNATAQFDLNLNIQNLSSETGALIIGLYAPTDEFLGENQCSVCESIPVSENTTSYLIKDVPAGEYAIAILHDTNGNNEMDFNFIGIPKEGYGFSNNPRSRMRQPTYEETKFTMNKNKELTIKMVNW